MFCHNCSHDLELFPDGYFVILKDSFDRDVKPCGCSKSPKWSCDQQLVRANRAATGRFIIHGFVGKYSGKITKLDCECLIDGFRWTPTIHSVVQSLYGCPKCAGNARPSLQEVLQKCIDICVKHNYEVIGFSDGYKNQYSRFEYICKIHGKQNVSYNNFVNHGSRCGGCAKDKQKDLGNGNGYFPERKDETDFLYVLNFNDKFIKVGRSFIVDKRIGELQRESGIQDIQKLRIFTATHQEIYDSEQIIHAILRREGLQHYVDWSTECFENESLSCFNNIMPSFINLQEISD